jgi:hypothetical protein
MEHKREDVTQAVGVELVKLEYGALRAEELAREGARLQVWALFFSLASVFGVMGVQGGLVADVVGLFPPLVLCLAWYMRHSEDVLHQVRSYLYRLEQQYGYCGYEHFSRSVVRSSHGGHTAALRGAFVLAQALAVGVVVVHLLFDHVWFVMIVVVGVVEGGILVVTWRELKR